jgi:hypothetical protein
MLDKIRPEMEFHPMAVAARDINDYADIHGMRKTCLDNGIEPEDLRYIAEQRAIRVLCASYGRNLQLKKVTTMQFSANELAQIKMIAIAYMDALMIGWKAKEIDAAKKSA